MLPVYSRLSTHHLLSGSLLPKSKTTPESCRVAEERGPERARTSLRPHDVSSGARTAANGSQLRAGAVSLSLHCSRCVLGTPGDKLERAGLGRNTERETRGIFSQYISSVHPWNTSSGTWCPVGVMNHGPAGNE